MQIARLGPRSRLWRSVVSAAVIGLLCCGSAYGGDDDFPMGPMSQFAFSVPADGGEIQSRWLEADTVAGTHVRLAMDAGGSGLKRAEVEGQLARFIRNPSLLRGIADARRRLHPGEPALTRIYVVRQTKTLRRGLVASIATVTVVTWDAR